MAVTSTEQDFLTLVEAGHRQPIAFRDRSALLSWADRELTDVELHAIGKRSLNNVLVLIGNTRFHPRSYSQVWVKAIYKSYRQAMIQYYRETTGGTQIDRYDIDHSVSRKTLKRHWPKAWVNVLYVESGINRSVGTLMEKETATDLSDSERVLFNAECFLKLFFERKSKLSRSQIATYMQQAAGRFLTTPEQGANRKEIANVNRILCEIFSEIDCTYQHPS